MRAKGSSIRRVSSVVAFIAALSAMAGAAQHITLGQAGRVESVKGGIEIHSGPGLLRVIAMRDDVLQIEMSPNASLPEAASWAVLPAALSARWNVRPVSTDASVGFDTKLLQVRVERSTLAVSIADASGRVLSRDARPVEFREDDSSGDLGFHVWKQMPEDEHYFGLGDKTGPLDRRGNSYVLWNTDAYRFQESTDPLYKSIPFFIAFRAGQSYGLFLDNTWRTTFDFGKDQRSTYSFGAEGGPLTYYFLYGPAPKQVEEDYAWLTGTTALPPLWSLGFQQSRYSYGTEARLREVADRLRKDRIPADALYMDIDYQQQNRPFTMDAAKFPEFSKFASEMAQKQFHLVLITDLHIAAAPGQHYAPYDSGMAGKRFAMNPDGSVYQGVVWPGLSVFPDFTRQEVRKWWGSLYSGFYLEGASGFWNDMNEPSVFNTPTKTMPLNVLDRIDETGFKERTTTQREIHNVFGMLNARATYSGLLALKPNQRPFVLTRAAYAGGQRYGATWTGDNSSTWNHLRLSTPMLESLGLGGFYMAGDDIGGYAGSPSMDLLTKWLEVGAFNPLDRDHTEKGSNDQEPWVGGPQQEAVRRRFIEERYRLLPYLYTIAEEASRTGIPIMRPLFLEFPDATEDKHPLDLEAGNEFLFGPDLLVAPAPHPDEAEDYPVTLPPTQWFDYWTGHRVAAAASNAAGVAKKIAVSTGAPAGLSHLQTVSIHPSVDALPVYVRAGSILPLQPLVQSTGQWPDGPLELRIYPGPNCHGSLYQDDGATLDYQHGAYLRMSFSCTVGPQSVEVQIGAVDGHFPPWWSEIEVVIYDWHAPKFSAKLNGTAASGALFDADQGTLRVRIPQAAAGQELTLTSTEE